MRRPTSSSTFSNDFSSEAARPNLFIFHITSTGGGSEYLCFLFRSDKNYGCYGNLKFPLTCMEKKWKLAFSVVMLGVFGFCFYINVY